MARVLLASYRIFEHNTTYLDEGLGWCDTFVDLQNVQATHDGRADAAGWWDTGYKELFIADTGTAVTTLALCYDLVQHNTDAKSQERKEKYMQSMRRFAEFVVNGTEVTPKCHFAEGMSAL